MAKDWAAEQASRVGSEIKRLRGKRSGQWLSDRTDELGYRVARTTISELENHKRKYIGVHELVVLARALDTAPAAMLFPGPYDESVDVLPGVPDSQFYALQEFSGESHLVLNSDDAEIESARRFERNIEHLRIARQIHALRAQQVAFLRWWESLEEPPAGDDYWNGRKVVADYQERIDLLQQQLEVEYARR